MPEGEGYQPSAEELGPEAELGQEYAEAAGITEQPVFVSMKNELGQEEQVQIGIQHVDSRGTVLDRTEWYEDKGEKQTIQYKYYEPDGKIEEKGGAIEYGKITEGQHAGKELIREHPMKFVDLKVHWEDDDGLGPMDGKGPALLEVVGQTTVGAGSREPYLRLEITDPDFMTAFADVSPKPGNSYGVIRQTLATNIPLRVHGRDIIARTISKASVDRDANGRVKKVTLHCYDWVEAPGTGNQ